MVEGAGHFFEKQMEELHAHVAGYLTERRGS
jgi:alpha/beta superfamily hydrolase